MRTDNNMILAVTSIEKWTQQTNTVNPRYPPSRYAIFRHSYSQILLYKIRYPPQIPLLRHRIRQNFICRASQNPLHLPLRLFAPTHIHPPSKDNISVSALLLLLHHTLPVFITSITKHKNYFLPIQYLLIT